MREKGRERKNINLSTPIIVLDFTENIKSTIYRAIILPCNNKRNRVCFFRIAQQHY